MNCKERINLSFLVGILATCILIGCATKTYRLNPQFNKYCKGIKTYGLLSPDVEVCQITAGGVREIIDKWCKVGKDNVDLAMKITLNNRNIKFFPIDIDKNSFEELEEIQDLYRAVSLSIRTHTYGPYVFPERVKDFNYSIGPIDKILEKYECDAVIFAYGTDEISTGGRKALMVLGGIASAFTGAIIMPRAGMTTVNIAVVDSSGSVLWYNFKALGGQDLRKQESALSLVNSIMSDFPECQR